jgi:hypothetical protein
MVVDGVDWFLGKRFNGLRWLLLLLGASKERMNVIVPRAEKGLELKRRWYRTDVHHNHCRRISGFQGHTRVSSRMRCTREFPCIKVFVQVPLFLA